MKRDVNPVVAVIAVVGVIAIVVAGLAYFSGARAPGTYSLSWTATTQGRWAFAATATDDLGRRTTADRTFTVGAT